MSAAIFPLDAAVVDSIYLTTTGLTNGSFTKLLFRNNAAAAESITVTESGTTPGVYHISFTPTTAGSGAGLYTYLVWETAKPQIVWTEGFQVGEAIPGAATIAGAVLNEAIAGHVTAGTLGDYINRIKKYVSNKLTVTGTTYSVKEDNGTTEFQSGTITTGERTPL